MVARVGTGNGDLREAGRKEPCLAPGMGLGGRLAPIRWKDWQ